MAVSNPCLCWVFYMLEPRNVLMNRSGWYDTLLFALYIIWKWQSVASLYVARFTYGHISRFARRYLGEAEFQHSGHYLHFWTCCRLRYVLPSLLNGLWYDILRGGGHWHCMYMQGVYQSTTTTTTSTYYDLYQLLRLLTVILVDSCQFCDGHDIQQLCAASTFVGISRQMLINSVIYVGFDISIFLRRTWSLFSDSSLSLDVATILEFVTLAGLDYFSDTSYTPDIDVIHGLFCRIWTISYSWSLWSGL